MPVLPLAEATPQGVAEIRRIVQARHMVEAMAPVDPSPPRFPDHIRMCDPAPQVRAKFPMQFKPGTRLVPVDKHHRKRFAAS